MNTLTAAPRAEIMPAPPTTREAAEAIVKRPLDLLPQEWRLPVWGFYAKFASLFRSQLDLAATLRDWIIDDGLTLHEAQAAFGELTRPARRAEIQFGAGQLIAELAKEVARLVADRRSREAREEQRQREEESRRRSDPEGVRKALAERMAGIGGGGA